MGGGGGAMGAISGGGNAASAGFFGGPGALFGSIQSQRGANQAADAAGNAAYAQLSAARKNYGRVSGIANQMSTQGLANYDKALTQADTNLSRQEDLMKQIDPTVLAASQNALKILQGQASPYLDPINQQRSLQRQQLLNNLREQMGPGAETSSAGIQALNGFDMQTNQLNSQQQQSALGQLGNTFSQFGSYQQGLSQMAQADTSQRAAITGQRAGLQMNQANLLNGASQNVYNSAGAPFVDEMMKGQYLQGVGNQLQQQGTQQQGQFMQMGAGLMGMMSDRRAKRDIIQLAKSIFRDVPTYLFQYIGETGWHVGTMAQDLLKVNPCHPAVMIGEDGLFRVNYGLVP